MFVAVLKFVYCSEWISTILRRVTVYMHQFHVTVSLFHIRVTITCYKVHVCADYVLQSTCMYQLRVTVYMH